MAFESLAHELEDLLPPKVKQFLVSLAAEVDSHKAAISELASIGGPVGETVATTVEGAAATIEKAQDATPAPTVTSTNGEAKVAEPHYVDNPPTVEATVTDVSHSKPVTDSPESSASTDHGNPEQALPYEQWPKSE